MHKYNCYFMFIRLANNVKKRKSNCKLYEVDYMFVYSYNSLNIKCLQNRRVLKAFYLVDSTVWKDMDPLASEV